MIGRSGERGPGISMLVARHDDDNIYIYIERERERCLWCNDYCCMKWTWWIEFKSCMSLFVLTLLGKVYIQLFSSPVNKGFRIHQLHLCRCIRPPPTTSILDMTLNNLIGRLQSWSTPSLPLLLGPLWSRVVAPDKVPSMGQIELFDHLTVYKQMTDVKWNC